VCSMARRPSRCLRMTAASMPQRKWTMFPNRPGSCRRPEHSRHPGSRHRFGPRRDQRRLRTTQAPEGRPLQCRRGGSCAAPDERSCGHPSMKSSVFAPSVHPQFNNISPSTRTCRHTSRITRLLCIRYQMHGYIFKFIFKYINFYTCSHFSYYGKNITINLISF